jgi:hypothetical protein
LIDEHSVFQLLQIEFYQCSFSIIAILHPDLLSFSFALTSLEMYGQLVVMVLIENLKIREWVLTEIIQTQKRVNVKGT